MHPWDAKGAGDLGIPQIEVAALAQQEAEKEASRLHARWAVEAARHRGPMGGI